MLHAAQPWLPLLDPGPEADARPGTPGRTPRRRRRRDQARAADPQPAVAVTAVTPMAAQAPAPEVAHLGLYPGQWRALRWAVLGVVMGWELSGREAMKLLGEPLADDEERLGRMQGLVRVNRSLQLLLPEPERCVAFLRGPCPALDGAAPIGLMLAEGRPGMARLSAHLVERVRGWDGGPG